MMLCTFIKLDSPSLNDILQAGNYSIDSVPSPKTTFVNMTLKSY